jgi:hypothetical protein
MLISIRTRAVGAFAIGLVVASSLATATIVPIEFDRSVQSVAIIGDSGGAEVDDDAVPFGGAGLFDEQSGVSLTHPGAAASSLAQQTSTMDPTTVVAVGGFTTSASISEPDATAEAFGLSTLVYRFEVTTPTSFVATGSIEATGQGRASVFLVSATARPIELEIQNGVLSIDEEGMLDPDSYVLQVNTSGWGQHFPAHQAPASGGFDVVIDLAPTVDVPSGSTPIAPVAVSPNPARGPVRITTPRAVSGVTIVGADGRIVRELSLRPTTSFVWDGRDALGRETAPGIYFITFANGLEGRVARLP